MTNLEKHKNDLSRLISQGDALYEAICNECEPIDRRKQNENGICFCIEYQPWYSESLIVIKQLLPDRLDDFKSYYEVPSHRKKITSQNYQIKDYLDALENPEFFDINSFEEKNAIPKFQQQLNILKSVQRRFDSSLFDIQQLVQADLFDDELAAAKMLNKNKFVRAAGAIAGVVLEKHLDQVLKNHNLICKKDTISPLNDALKAGNVYDIPTFRKIQHLGDIRNLCDHNSKREPTQEEVEEMINGVDSIIKTVF